MDHSDEFGWAEDGDFGDADTADLGNTGAFAQPDAGFDALSEPDDHGADHADTGDDAAAGDQYADHVDLAVTDLGGTADDPDPLGDTYDDQPDVDFGDDRHEAVDALVGTDPDADGLADHDGWQSDPFPPPLDLGAPPEPVDGFPWSDPDTLGQAGVGGDLSSYGADAFAETAPPAAGDLFSYAGEDLAGAADPWGALMVSEDPATSALARWWAPGR